MSALPLGRYRQLLHQLLQLNEQTAALRAELTAFVDKGVDSESTEVLDPAVHDDSAVGEPSASSSDRYDQAKINNNSFAENQSSLDSSSLQLCEDFESILQINKNEAPVSNHDKNNSPNAIKTALNEKLKSNHSEYTPKSCHNSLQKKASNKNKSYNVVSIDDHSDGESSSIVRKPHFLDDDYHLKSNDACQILKPHFLDQSPSSDDEKIVHIADAQIYPNLKSNGKKHEHSRFQNGNDEIKFHKEMYGFSDFRMDESRNLDDCNQDKGDHYPNTMLSSHTSSSSRYSHGFENACFVERDMWQNQDSCSVKSFFSAGSENVVKMENSQQQQIGSKVDCVYSLLSLLSLSTDCNTDMSEYLLEMSKSIESCIAMRQSGCVPLLVQLIHSKHSRVSKNKAAQALHNMIHIQPEDKSGRREVRVLRLLEHVRDYCYTLEDFIAARKENNANVKDDMGKHPVQSVAALMKLSFDEEHRHVMCQLGGLQSLASLVTVDQVAHGSVIEDIQCITMRKYSGMALTNLTFGDGNNKALLCSFKEFMISLVEQLQSPNDDMRQVTAAVLRNLSWRADSASKQILRDVGAVKGLTLAAMTGHKEATLKSILSALWNLTAHCSLNKADICSVDGALAFLVKMLNFDAPSKTLAIIENAGGILRNVSSHIAIREDYRVILREHNCLKILLQQLKSPSLTIVSNSCGTLWNLSARCQEDQLYLWEHGAVPMLRSLIHSKHKMIAMGSSAALKNLLNSTPGKSHIKALDSTARDLNLPLLPTLGVRKQKALEQELDQNLSETCENIEPNTSPTTSNRDEKLLLSAAEKHLAISIEKRKMSSSSPLIGHLSSQMTLSHSANFGNFQSSVNTLQNSISKGLILKSVKNGSVNRSDSKDSVTSTHSDSVYEINCRNNKLPYSDCSKNNLSKKSEESSSNNATLSKVDLDFIKQCSRSRNLMKYDCVNIPLCKNTNMSRNNYSESGYDMENEGCDQPIDYSQKYSETKSTCNLNTSGNQFNLSDSYQNPKDKMNIASVSRSPLFHIKGEMNGRQNNDNSSEDSVVPFGDYQETDLDQPTDYSLRYAEDNSDVVSTISEPQIISVHEDTIKHFCTEGTPYETPINFSTATSMSDLRAIGRLQVDPSSPKENKIIDSSSDVKENINMMAESDERDTCSLEDNAKPNNDEALNDSRAVNDKTINLPKSEMSPFVSKFSSGIVSPEKPINYCEEGTPGYFSRVSSLSSLGEIGEDVILENAWSVDGPNSSKQFLTSNSENLINTTEEINDSKSTLENNTSTINYAEETPLMFSRSSSLDSLSECSVPDQADDVRSVVSEFSRLTSGCISPSELPDSPTQSPLPRIDESGNPCSHTMKPYKPSSQNNKCLHSVFEDEVSTFKFENTPIEFSTGTSLSSLTIDDDPMEKIQIGKHKANKKSPVEPKKSLSNVKVNAYKPPMSNPETQYGNHMEMNREKQMSYTRMSPRTPEMSPPNISHKTDDILISGADSCHMYCTEDTPAILSKVGSQSDLSIISIPEMDNDFISTPGLIKNNCDISTTIKREFSDDSSNMSGDSDHLLAECIQSGMPKRKIPSYYLPEDELENYAVEGSPFHHSAHSSLSDLTIGSHGTEYKARLVKNLERYSPNKQLMQNNDFVQFKQSPQQGSLAGSLSSVSLESDDGHFLEMAIRVGVPQHIGDKIDSNFRNGSDLRKIDINEQENESGLSDYNTDDARAHYNPDDKSEEHVTVLNRNDSLSSLSVDSLGSNEGEQALFEQCIKSGMPKVSSVHKWEGVHAKTLDKNFKARLSYRNKSDLLDDLDETINKTDIHHDTVFENLVTAGAFATCSRKHSKTEENLSDKNLLEEAIYCGMPKKKEKIDKETIESRFEKMKLYSDKSDKGTVHNCGNMENNSAPNVFSKNGQASSVVASSIPAMSLQCALITTTDVKTTMEIENITESSERNVRPVHLSRPPEINPSIKGQVISEAVEKTTWSNGITSRSLQSNSTTKIGSEKLPNYDVANNNDSFIPVDYDNDSKLLNNLVTESIEDLTMIESITEKDSSPTVKLDKDSTDTWNESSSCPVDVSFPTASGSLPLLGTFNPDEITCATGLPDLMEESIIISENDDNPKDSDIHISSDAKPSDVESQFYSLKMNDSLKLSSSISNSAIIEKEASRLALMIKNNASDFSFCSENDYSIVSDLDNVNPPSHMGSLVSMSHSLLGNHDECRSENSEFDKHNNMVKLSIENNFRKKSLSSGIFHKKSDCLNDGHFEHTENNSLNNLENIKPPSEMDDMMDMENSMLSVASIVSEVADVHADYFSSSNLDVNQPNDSSFCLYSNFRSETGNSLLLDLLTAEQNNWGSSSGHNPFANKDSKHIDADLDNSRLTENRKSINKNSLTPKQKRQLVKERYKTYTIDGDILFNSNHSATSLESENNEPSRSTDNIREDDNRVVKINSDNDMPTFSNTIEISSDLHKSDANKVEFKIKKSIKQRRIENSERFKTQTIDRLINLSPDTSANELNRKLSQESNSNYLEAVGTSDSFHSQIIKDATKAFEFLQNQPVEDSSYIDLECETMSLISEDDSELNSFRMKTLTKSFKNYLPVIESPTAVDKCVEMNLKNLECFQVNGNVDGTDDADEKHTSDFNSSECEQNSETESADQNHYADSETEQPQEKPKPVISKPTISKCLNSSESLSSEDNGVKGIRGRRKGVYVSPYKRNDVPSRKITTKANLTVKANKSNITLKTPSAAATKVSCDSKKPIKATINIAKAKNSEKINKTTKCTAVEPKSTNCKLPPTLVRQGTFTKEESVFPNSTDVESAKRSTKAGNINQNVSTSKLPQLSSKFDTPKSSLKKTSSIESNISSGKNSVKLNIKKSQSKIRYSSSNQSLQSSDSSKTIKSSPKSDSTNHNTVSSTTANTSPSKTLIKDTASKVATLWKRVEQNRNLSKPTTKTWIAKDNEAQPESSTKNGSVGKTKLIRSSTFECSPKATSTIPVPLKQKSSITIRDTKLNNCRYNSKVPIVKSSKC